MLPQKRNTPLLKSKPLLKGDKRERHFMRKLKEKARLNKKRSLLILNKNARKDYEEKKTKKKEK